MLEQKLGVQSYNKKQRPFSPTSCSLLREHARFISPPLTVNNV
jgi:hypothetical protein